MNSRGKNHKENELTRLRRHSAKLEQLLEEQREISRNFLASDQSLRALLDNTKAAIYLKDAKGRYMLLSKWCESFMKYSTMGVAGKTDMDIFPPESAKNLMIHDREVIESGIPKDFEEEILYEGKVFTFLANKFPVFDDNGKVYGICGVAIDITARKQAETAMRESEEKYRALFECSKDAIMILDETGFKDCNPSTLDIYGFKSKDDFTGFHPGDLSPVYQPSGKESGEEFQLQIENALENGFSSFNWVHRKTDGTLFPCEILLGKCEMGGKEVVQAAVRDITERYKSEEAIRESESRFRLLAESIPLGIAVLDPEQRFDYLNPRFTEIFGYTREELPDWQSWFEKAYPDPDYRHEFAVFYQNEVMVNPEVGRMRKRILNIRCKDGSNKTIHFRTLIMPNRNHLLTFEDITDYRKMEIQLREAQKMEAIGTLAGGIAHDFNNLLMGIQGYTSLMMLEIDQQHPFYENLEAIDKQIRSGADLTRQLLGYARGGRYEVKPTNMNELVDQTLRMFARTRKELNIYRHYSDGPCVADIDRSQIEQVLLNLFLNAWHAMPGGGDLYLETSRVQLNKKDITNLDVVPGHYIMISVRDTGIGMDRSTRERIFEPFFTTKEMGRGTGLGLATVYGIVKGHSGFIKVHSKPREGSTFEVYLPLSKRNTDAKSVLPSQTITKGHETILLIDDEDVVLIVTRRILIMLGYKVLTASSGHEAIELYSARSHDIDLVILDIIMPGMGCSELFAKLKGINPHVKVILSSGYSVEGQAQEIMVQGAMAFIQKPFGADNLSVKIREVLEKKTRARAENDRKSTRKRKTIAK
jgi:PAS domain S-box-containing protein